MSNESIGKTVIVAILVCLVCSILVSTAAVRLKPLQEKNKALYKKTNILEAAGILEENKDVEELFGKIETRYVDLKTGAFNETINSDSYNVERALKNPDQSISIEDERDLANINRRVKTVEIYLVKEDNEIQTIILPVYGKGLWSTMYAFIALEGDGRTVKGLRFYEHGETPGLGGEIDNPDWQEIWVGKQIYDEDWNMEIDVLKGAVDPTSPESVHQVDGLSGATLTTVGVRNLVRYWLGRDGFYNFLSRISTQGQGVENG